MEAVITSLPQIEEDLAALEAAEDRYRYLIDLGKQLPPMPTELKTESARVPGCMSQVWVVGHQEGPVLTFQADGDSFIGKGLVVIVLLIFEGLTPAEITGKDALQVFHRLGLDNALTLGRRNGLYGMVQRVRTIAQQHQTS